MKKILGIIIGIACVVIGVFILISYSRAQKVQTAETTATIIRVDSELETDTDGFETRHYYPVIEYTVEGQRYETRLPNSDTTDSTEYKEGQTVTIQYNPDNPNELSKKGNKGGLIGGIFFIVAGLVMAVASVIGKM